MLDATDVRILDLLQGNARISNADIARELISARESNNRRVPVAKKELVKKK